MPKPYPEEFRRDVVAVARKGGDRIAFKGSLVIEVELFQVLSGWKPRSADAAFTTVGFAGGDLALQAGGEELFMAPVLGAGTFGESLDRVAECRGFERSSEVTGPR